VINEMNKVIEKSNTIFQRMAPVKPVEANIFWFIVAMLLMLATYILPFELNGYESSYRALCIYLATGLFILPFGVSVGYNILRSWAIDLDNFAKNDDQSLSAWFVKDLEFVRGDSIMVLAGITLGVLTVIAYSYGGYFSTYSNWAVLFLCLIMFMSSAFAGMGLYNMFCVCRTFWRLGQKSKITYTVHKHRFGIMSVGTVLFKCWMIIGLIWAVYMASAFVGYQGNDYNDVMHLQPVWLLAYPTFPFIIGGFISCQIPLHKRMVEYKRREIFLIDNMLEKIKPERLQDLSEINLKKIDFLNKQKEQYRSLPEWPFSLVSLLGAGASSVTALMPAFIIGDMPDWLSSIIFH
jgi:hypothetical protein